MKQLELRDIHLPDAVSWWPPAVGWWVMLFALLLLVAIIFYSIKKMKQAKVRKIALTEFDKIKQAYQQHKDKTLLSQKLSQLLRQIVLSSEQRSEVASVTGKEWLLQLNKLHPKGQLELKWLELLVISSYQKQSDYDAEALLSHLEQWLSTFPKRYLL